MTSWLTADGDTVEVFRDVYSANGPGKWYWRVQAPNGRVVLTGGESFTRRWNAVRAARRRFPDEQS